MILITAILMIYLLKMEDYQVLCYYVFVFAFTIIIYRWNAEGNVKSLGWRQRYYENVAGSQVTRYDEGGDVWWTCCDEEVYV